MNRNTWIGILIAVSIFTFARAFAMAPIVKNGTLQKVLDAMSPDMTTHALSATFVRTIYEPQALNAYGEKQDAKVKRTTISEFVISSNGVRESVCDVRKTRSKTFLGEGTAIKQFAFHYANNGKRLQTYDSKNNRGLLRASPKTGKNHLSLVVGPYTRTSRGRFMSRSMPVLLARFNGAQVTSEAGGSEEGKDAVTIEGQYADSDPQRYFTITVIPGFNYAVAIFREYDVNKRILTETRAGDFVQVTRALWLPRSTRLEKYTYDDREGNSVQRFKLDILDPRTVPVDEGTFSLIFPDNANIRDVTANINIGKIRREASESLDATMENITVAGYEIPTDKKGKAIVARAQEAYAREHQHSDTGAHKNPEKFLELPQVPRSKLWFTIPTALLLAVTIVMGWRIYRKKSRITSTNHQQERKGGTV